MRVLLGALLIFTSVGLASAPPRSKPARPARLEPLTEDTEPAWLKDSRDRMEAIRKRLRDRRAQPAPEASPETPQPDKAAPAPEDPPASEASDA